MLFTSAIRCQLQRLCPIQPPSSSIVVPSGIKLAWGSGKGQQRVQPASGVLNFPAPTSSPLNISVSIGTRVVCYVPLWNNVTADWLQTRIARSCTFAKYLGTVQASVASNTAGATAVDIFYDATITTVATPTIRVRYVSAGGPIPFATTTDPSPTDTCTECKRLTLDVCLRDAKCAAMADCVMQYQSPSSTTTVTSGTKRSLEADITACLPAAITNGVSRGDVNGASWCKLVNASACYSRSACPLALAPRLIYTGSISTLGSLTIPLTLMRDGTTVTLSSAADPDSLAVSLRGLIQYDDIQVAQVAVDSTSSSTSVTTFAWTISYGHWAGSLPVFISSECKEWTLVAYPTISVGAVIPNDSILELIPRSSTTTASS
ncbi:hypothetical protein PHYSODRAFT_509573 [Phytophthora sojae]|uniref:Uncharacterized protein n=1 Tax=Phytophthora sojae (strain P6497) TaxID=1094619 RepID=G4ZLR7_PHYSP|nr:hypothetical protein PHYSODRAFT_509573 [Phytophthora sojae]EGZ14960.1 hypothetical protein PHYSODRAFT_509573 [Phytophthora sojae]|eukprot:XP_009528709.1 hypothetical protein PHYSODRAFT_509573 [Phytophthora sojae]